MEKLYPGYKFYGPYRRKDNYSHMVLRKPDGKRTSLSYAKYLMEKHLQRRLLSCETVDHIDRNPQNNSLDNLQILSRSEHAKLDVLRLKEQSFTCPMCAKLFKARGAKLSKVITERKRGKVGPFCSKSCAGKYGTQIQHHQKQPLEIVEVFPQYFQRNKSV